MGIQLKQNEELVCQVYFHWLNYLAPGIMCFLFTLPALVALASEKDNGATFVGVNLNTTKQRFMQDFKNKNVSCKGETIPAQKDFPYSTTVTQCDLKINLGSLRVTFYKDDLMAITLYEITSPINMNDMQRQVGVKNVDFSLPLAQEWGYFFNAEEGCGYYAGYFVLFCGNPKEECNQKHMNGSVLQRALYFNFALKKQSQKDGAEEADRKKDEEVKKKNFVNVDGI